jgi:uncharacterized protein (TIGR02996 family)
VYRRRVDVVEQDLLDAIARDPEDPAPYLVYADWLQGRGSPRGELMTLQNATEDRPGDHRISDAALAHVRANAAFYLGELAPLIDEPDYLELGWRCGFIASAVLTWNRRWRGRPVHDGPSPAGVLRALLTLDAARFLTRLVVEPTSGLDARFIADALAEHPPRALRELWIGPRDPQSATRDAELGELTAWRGMPELRELVVHGDPTSLGSLALPALRSATIMLTAGSRRARRVYTEIAAAAWPNLERLHLWSPDAPPSLEPVFARDDLVMLGDLAIVNCSFADAACRLLARSALAPQLHRLSLSRGTLTDAGIEILVGHRDRFPSLARIDVSETFVTAAGHQRLLTLAPEVVARDLRTGLPRPLIPELDRSPD